MTEQNVLLDSLDKMAVVCNAVAVEVGRLQNENAELRERVPKDCRTCVHYLHGRHACDLFYQRGQDCIEGSHWNPAPFAPVSFKQDRGQK